MSKRFAVLAAVWGAAAAVPDGGASALSAVPAPDRPAQHCAMQIRLFAPDSRFADPEDFRAGAALFFGAVRQEELDQALQGTAPGAARDVSERFTGSDSRWRLLRPLALPSDPNALVIAPPQAQYLIRPPEGALYASLILAGLPQDGAIARPALAGRLGPAAGARAGQLFSIEPADASAACPLAPAQAAAWADQLLRDHLRRERE